MKGNHDLGWRFAAWREHSNHMSVRDYNPGLHCKEAAPLGRLATIGCHLQIDGGVLDLSDRIRANLRGEVFRLCPHHSTRIGQKRKDDNENGSAARKLHGILQAKAQSKIEWN